jgi:signal transduction histidine kinase
LDEQIPRGAYEALQALLAGEHAARAMAERAERRSALLAEANARMCESMLGAQPLACLAELLVPRVADWCTVHLAEGATLSPAGRAHADPQKRLVLEELEARFPPRWEAPHLAARVIAGGRPLHAAAVDAEFLQGVVMDDAHRRLLGSLADRSLLAVPLLARGQVLGALSLGSGPRRAFAAGDLELALELGRGAGVAADNAQRFRQAEAAARARDDFLIAAAHELGTPLSALVWSARTMLQPHVHSRPAEMARLAQVTLRQADKLGRLLRNVVQATGSGQDALVLERESVDLAALVLEVVAHFALELQRSRCELALELDSPLVGHWDRARLEQLLVNLLSNACKYGAGQPVAVDLRRSGDRARLRVADHGPGLDPAHQRRLFSRFERGPAARQGPGLGLGLYLCRLAAEAHGGHIEVDSRPGHGATFTVELPGASARDAPPPGERR